VITVFDTVAGLPVHALVVHAVVVLLPLMSLVTIAVAVRRSWRRAAAPWVLLADLAMLGVTWVARLSGQDLRTRLSGGGSQVATHANRGDLLPWFALALVVAAAVLVLAVRRRALVPVAIVLSLGAGIATTTWTVVVGDSGARAVWESTVQNTKAP